MPRPKITPARVFEKIEGAIRPTLEAAGFKDTESEWFNQGFGSQYSVYTSSAAKIRLVWDGHYGEFYLECDRLPNEAPRGAWIYLAEQSFNTNRPDGQRIDELRYSA